MSSLVEIKSFVRDLNLNLITNSTKIEIDPSKRYCDKIRWFMPNRKLIASIIEAGGVLTGSRSLRCYKVNGEHILDRRTKDWDFIITQDIAFKICAHYDIDIIPGIDKVISIKNQRAWRHPDYSESYRVGPVDVQMIIKEELPEFQEVNGVRFSSLTYILNEKVKLIDELYSISQNSSSVSDERKEIGKHLDDMTRTIIKFNSIRNENT
jgi:hypothetical protein